MPPKIALILTLGFIAYLFRRDFREKPNVTAALWIPFTWTFIIASKTLTQWLTIFGLPGFGGSSVEQGSSVDAIVFFGLIALGIYILGRRQVQLSKVIKENPWLVAFIIYCLLSILWSDFPFVSFKRWIKVLGHPIMVLIIFTEPDPKEALVRLMKRCAYVVLPVSILWMKYYPNLGRKATDWGTMGNCGISGGKNELGGLCFILCFFFFWHLLRILRMEKSKTRRNELLLVGGLLFMAGYCLRKAHSATSVLSLLIAVLIMMVLGLRFVNKKLIVSYVLVAILLCVTAQLTFDIYGSIVNLSGHDDTIEGRGRLWQFLLATDTNPIFGTGFESYWLGDRALKTVSEFQWRPTQAHNGYLEIYLNLGAVGLLIVIGWIIATLLKCGQDLLTDFEWGRFTMGYLFGILAHNWTEAGFKGLSLMLLVFFIIAIKYPFRIASEMASLDSVGAEENEQWMYSEAKV